MQQPQIFLASASPRRRELLTQIGVYHQRVVVDVPEQRQPAEVPAEYVLRLALAKARAGREALPAGEVRPVLGADTVVALGDEVLEKPRDRDDGIAMLQRLSGHTHEVLTAVSLVGEHEASRLSVSHVTFRTLAVEECARYWDSGEPADKAGGYGIQGRAAAFVSNLQGSYSGVMGLPLFETAELLNDFGIAVI